MNINQQFTYPTFKAKGTPIGGKGHAFERQLRTFTVPKDDLKKIHTIAEECGIMHEMFYRNKSIISKIGNLFGNNVFTKGTKERTYFLNSILNNFRLSIKVPTPQAKNKYNELFVFGIGKKEENEVNYDKNSHSIEEAVSGVLAVAIMEFNKVHAYAAVENTDLSYYAGTSFKVKGDGLVITWDKYGNCTKIDGKVNNDGGSVTAKLTASYTYEKK